MKRLLGQAPNRVFSGIPVSEQLEKVFKVKTRLKWLIAILTIGAVGLWIYNLPPKPVYLPSLIVAVNGRDSGFVSALGTWGSDADKTLYPSLFPVKTSPLLYT